MTEEQEKLVLQIVSHLDDGAMQGEWPDERCHYCHGISTGYSDSRDFTHRPSCIVPLIKQLRRSIRETEQ